MHPEHWRLCASLEVNCGEEDPGGVDEGLWERGRGAPSNGRAGSQWEAGMMGIVAIGLVGSADGQLPDWGRAFDQRWARTRKIPEEEPCWVGTPGTAGDGGLGGRGVEGGLRARCRA